MPKITLDDHREQTSELGGVDGSDGLRRSNRGAFIGTNTWLMSIQPEKKSWRWRAETTLSRNFALKGRRGIGQYLEGEVGSGEGCFWFFSRNGQIKYADSYDSVDWGEIADVVERAFNCWSNVHEERHQWTGYSQSVGSTIIRKVTLPGHRHR